MQLRRLGTSDLNVTPICLGTMTFGRQNTEEEGHAQMNYAFDRGVNFFDTAEMYAVPPGAETYGRTEEIIGSWFTETGRRDQVILASKVAGPAPHMPWIRGGHNRLDAENITAALETSLKRLQTDYIDLYQLHWPDRAANHFGTLDYAEDMFDKNAVDAMQAALECLAGLMKQGKIREIGLSNETPWGLMKFLELAKDLNLPRIQSIQNPYNLLNRTFDNGTAELCLYENIGLLAYSPTARGRLSGKYLGDALPAGSAKATDTRAGRYDGHRAVKATQDYVALAEAHGLDPCRVAIAFVASKPWVSSTIIGATDLDQLQNDIAAFDLKLDDRIKTAINEIHLGNPNPSEVR